MLVQTRPAVLTMRGAEPTGHLADQLTRDRQRHRQGHDEKAGGKRGQPQHELRVQRHEKVAERRNDEVERRGNRPASKRPRSEQAEVEQRPSRSPLYHHEQPEQDQAAQQERQGDRACEPGQALDQQKGSPDDQDREHPTPPVHRRAGPGGVSVAEHRQVQQQAEPANDQDDHEDGAPAQPVDQEAPEDQPGDLTHCQDRGVDGHGPATFLPRKDRGDLGHDIGQHQGAA